MNRNQIVILPACIAAVTLVSTFGICSANAGERVARVMVIWGNAAPRPALDWDAEGSVAMIVMPKDTEQDSFNTGVNPFDLSDFDRIADTIAANRPDLSEDVVTDLAAILFTALDDGSFLSSKEVRNVRQGGPDLIENIYWDNGPAGLPAQGSMAQAGPDGDIAVLGTFWFKANSGTYPIPSSDFILTSQASATHSGQIAIGWFTK